MGPRVWLENLPSGARQWWPGLRLAAAAAVRGIAATRRRLLQGYRCRGLGSRRSSRPCSGKLQRKRGQTRKMKVGFHKADGGLPLVVLHRDS